MIAVVTDDDVAVQDSMRTAGRRGVGVTVLLEKIAGAAAEQGLSLKEVADVARHVNENGRSMVWRSPRAYCRPQASRESTSPRTRWEIGIGIHGEPGRRRVAVGPAKEVATMSVEPILADMPLGRGDSVIAFVNGMGGTPLIELYVMYNEVAKILHGQGVTVARSLVGP